MADYIQFALPNTPPQCSGRGVRFELLSPTERDHALVSAATLAGDDKAKLNILRQREGVRRMLRAVTKSKGLTDANLLSLPDGDWIALSHQKLVEDGVYDGFFTAQDDEILAWFYREYHEPSEKDVRAIAGKVQMVSTG